MDDLVEKIRDMLGDPETAQKLSALTSQLGGGDTPSAAPPPAVPPPDNTDGGMASMLAGLMPLMSGLTRDDDNTVLLRALRPYMHGGREKRLDEAIRLLQLLKFVPLLQSKGGLGHE